MRRCIVCILFSFFVSCLAGCLTMPEIRSGSVEVNSDDVNVRVAFNEKDRHLITSHYHKAKKGKKGKKMPPGLAKKKSLPPGLQKQVEKNGVLPPGLQGRDLPHALERQLSKLPSGYVRVKVGGDVVLMNEKTRVIFDVILGVDE